LRSATFGVLECDAPYRSSPRRVRQVAEVVRIRRSFLVARGLLLHANTIHIPLTKGRLYMRTVLGIALALLLGLGVTAGWAEDLTGKIQSVDTTERVFVLDDGTKIWVAEGVPMDTLKEGASVKASYEERDGKKVATSIEVAE
jgi:hypothetical protein